MGPVNQLLRTRSTRNVLLPRFTLRVLAIAQFSAWAFVFKPAVLDVARAQRRPAIWGTGFQVRVVRDPECFSVQIMNWPRSDCLSSACVFTHGMALGSVHERSLPMIHQSTSRVGCGRRLYNVVGTEQHEIAKRPAIYLVPGSWPANISLLVRR